MKKRLTLRQMLNQIDAFLAPNDKTAGQLWDVLSALRGPDAPYLGRKSITTNVIRTRAFPRTAKRAMKLTVLGLGVRSHIPASFLTRSANVHIKPSDPYAGALGGSHFTNHIERAAKVLKVPVVEIVEFQGTDVERGRVTL